MNQVTLVAAMCQVKFQMAGLMTGTVLMTFDVDAVMASWATPQDVMAGLGCFKQLYMAMKCLNQGQVW